MHQGRGPGGIRYLLLSYPNNQSHDNPKQTVQHGSAQVKIRTQKENIKIRKNKNKEKTKQQYFLYADV